jgi:Ca-activated chloride channel family protein
MVGMLPSRYPAGRFSRRRLLRLAVPGVAAAALAVLAAVAPPAAPAASAAPTGDSTASPRAGEQAAAPAALTPPAAITDLDAKYRDFLDEAAPLLSDREREVFLSLTRDYQRDDFIKRFWEVRDPYPQTPQNELRDVWDERVKVARERYGNVVEDRARVLLIHGEPGHVYHSRCSDTVLPLEIWSYDRGEHNRHAFSVIFVQSLGAVRGRFSLWVPSEGLESLLALQARARAGTAGAQEALAACADGSDIAGYLSTAIDERETERRGLFLPKKAEEWLSGFAAASTELPAGAEMLPADLEVSFPGRTGSRTVVQTLVRVAPGAAKPQHLEDKSFYAFMVDGEVLRKDELFEHFRYRFSFPADPPAAPAMRGGGEPAAPAGIPLVFQRYLRPGPYKLVLKVEDLGGRRYFRAEHELQVPAAPEQAVAPAALAASGGAGNTSAATAGQNAAGTTSGGAGSVGGTGAAFAEANAAIPAGDQTVRLLAPPDGLLVGGVRVDALVTGSGIDHVRFLLDGRQALSKRRPPFSVDLNLGGQPHIHVVRAVAEAADGSMLAEDQLVLNGGPHRFAVRLVEPQAGKRYVRSLRAEVKVEVPEDEKLDRLELYRDETLVATLYQPPWTQPVLVPEGPQLSYVRAVAYLADGNSTEDLVVINAPNPGERIDVQLVELYATVTDHRGRPVDGLTREDFRVYEDGSEQTVRRFERVENLPIYAGVLLDTSGSMTDHLDTAVQAALGFFNKVIQSKDRAAVITFNGETNLAVRFTNDREVLAGGLSGLRADGSTALYDSIIYALYYFGGVRGKRAVVLLTDGRDEGSKYRFRDALEYAKHSGIAFYTIGLGLTAKEPDIRLKLAQLATETGGRSFFIERAAELAGTYSDIETELRSQYLLAYQSAKQGNDGKFRAVGIKLQRPGLEARTVPGYYP